MKEMKNIILDDNLDDNWMIREWERDEKNLILSMCFIYCLRWQTKSLSLTIQMKMKNINRMLLLSASVFSLTITTLFSAFADDIRWKLILKKWDNDKWDNDKRDLILFTLSNQNQTLSFFHKISLK